LLQLKGASRSGKLQGQLKSFHADVYNSERFETINGENEIFNGENETLKILDLCRKSSM